MLEGQTIEFEDVQFEVPWGYVVGRWYGNRKVRPLLALHGWQDNLGTWDRLIPLLPRHIGYLCIDLPGQGRSSKYPLGMIYHVIDYVHIVARIVQEYKWRKVSLMGHSMGGVVAFAYASLYPNKVDLLIQIDILKQPHRGKEYLLAMIRNGAEKTMVENERLQQLHKREPPSYTYEELEEVLHRGSKNSIARENCKHVLNRSIMPSQLYPEKFYFSRDGRMKWYQEFSDEPGLAIEMAKRMRNVNYLLIKASRTRHVTAEMEPIIKVIREYVPHFELHQVEGTHHVHLNNPEGVAKPVGRFILKYRPASLDSWSMDYALKHSKL
uniref:AB hydrolase-1 domain-containing protein n=1 Tax=Stomoxys calcitrans TaxID=35570 RepID=A0A1I8PTW0_STOCA